MRRNRTTTWIATWAAGWIALAASTASAQQPLSEIRIQELIRQAAQIVGGAPAGQTSPAGQPTGQAGAPPASQPGGQSGAPATGQPGGQPGNRSAQNGLGSGQTVTPVAPFPLLPPDTRPVVQLTLDEAVKLCLDRNLSIAVARLNPPTFDGSIAALRSTYWPQFASLLSQQSLENPPATSLVGVPAGASGVTTTTTTFNGGFTQNVPWGGGAASLTLNNARGTSTSTTVLYDPTYTPTYTAQYTQPILRGFAVDATRQALYVTKVNQEISDIQLQSTITNTLSTVREAYWNYVYTVQAVEVAQQSVNLADELVRDNQARLQVGTMAPIDVVTAQSQEAQARQGLVQANANRRTAEIALKQLIVAGTQDPNWGARIDPIDRPEFQPEEIDVDAAIRRALSARTDLAVAKKDLQANDYTLKFLRNQIMPQADLVARYGLSGLGGTKILRSSSSISGGSTLGFVPGGFGDALSSLFGQTYPTWNVSLNISMPVGQNVANAAVAAARIQMDQNASQVRQIELQIATDVTNAATNVRSAIEAVQAAEAAQELAQKTYEAEQAKFDVGLSTNYNVILDLNALNTVKNSYLQAVLNYRNFLVELDRLQQTTLNSLNITLVPTSNLGGPPVGSAR